MTEPTFTDDELDGIHRTKFLKKLEETEADHVASGLSLYSDLTDRVDELESLVKRSLAQIAFTNEMQDKSHENLSDRVAELEKWVNRPIKLWPLGRKGKP